MKDDLIFPFCVEFNSSSWENIGPATIPLSTLLLRCKGSAAQDFFVICSTI